MEQTGTLRKRSRRTLVKINGQNSLPYNDAADLFDYGFGFQSRSSSHLINRDTIIRISSLQNSDSGKSPSSNPITREPSSQSRNRNDSEGSLPNHNVEALKTRPYLLKPSAFVRLRALIFLGMLIGIYPWVWNNKTKRVDKWSPTMVKVWKVSVLYTLIQTTCLMCYHIRGFVHQWSNDLESYRGMFAYFTGIYWHVFCIIWKGCTYFYQDQIRQYINSLQNFNQFYVEKYMVYLDEDTDFGNGNLVIKYAIPAGLCQIVNSLLFYVVMPYQPFYLTSKIWPKPWYWLIPGALQDLSLVCQTALVYCLTSWVLIAHTTTVDFWLRETHKENETGYTRDVIRHPKQSIGTYRALQVLCIVFNNCMSPVAIPLLKVSVALGFIPCGFILIRSMNHLFIDELPGVLVYPFGVLNCSLVGFGCLSMAAEMYDIANSFIYSWSRTKKKELRRLLLSCPTLKVKVGRFYAVSAATTITFFQVMTDNVINCIITFP